MKVNQALLLQNFRHPVLASEVNLIHVRQIKYKIESQVVLESAHDWETYLHIFSQSTVKKATLQLSFTKSWVSTRLESSNLYNRY